MDARIIAGRALWAAIKTTAKLGVTIVDDELQGPGLDKAWLLNAEGWGPPLEAGEQNVDHDGRTLKGRTFLKIGVVVWVPEQGAVVVGWPAQP